MEIDYNRQLLKRSVIWLSGFIAILGFLYVGFKLLPAGLFYLLTLIILYYGFTKIWKSTMHTCSQCGLSLSYLRTEVIAQRRVIDQSKQTIRTLAIKIYGCTQCEKEYYKYFQPAPVSATVNKKYFEYLNHDRLASRLNINYSDTKIFSLEEWHYLEKELKEWIKKNNQSL